MVAALEGQSRLIEMGATLSEAASTRYDPAAASNSVATAPYVASQGSAIGRRGRVHIDADEDGAVWVSGATNTRITGALDL